MVFPGVMYGCESWTIKKAEQLKNWCFWTAVLEKTLESPLHRKEIQPVHPKGNQSWVFIGRTDVEAETPILWPPDAKSWFIWKDPDAGKDWGQEEKGTTEDEMVGWHHRLDGHGFGWTLGVYREVWGAVVHGIAKSWIRLNDWNELNWVDKDASGRDPDGGKDWRQKEKGTTEYEMVGWYHRLNGHEFEETPGDSGGQGSLVCYSSWGHKESDTT